MTELSFTQENMPEPEEFQMLLAEAMARSNPLDELLELALELREYEQKYGLSSRVFYAKYQQGEMGDSGEVMDWAMAYDSFLERKTRIETALMREAVWREAEVVAA